MRMPASVKLRTHPQQIDGRGSRLEQHSLERRCALALLGLALSAHSPDGGGNRRVPLRKRCDVLLPLPPREDGEHVVRVRNADGAERRTNRRLQGRRSYMYAQCQRQRGWRAAGMKGAGRDGEAQMRGSRGSAVEQKAGRKARGGLTNTRHGRRLFSSRCPSVAVIATTSRAGEGRGRSR